MKKDRKAVNMITDSPGRALLLFALPMILGNLFQQFYNIMDSVVVGRFVSEEALASVGASYSITNVFIAIAIGGGIGSSVVVSQFLGAKQLGNMKTAISTTLINFLTLSVLLGTLGFLFNEPILTWMNTPENVFADASVYLSIYFVGLPFLFMYNVQAAIFQSLGDSRTPLYILIACCIVNIVLDLVFVIVFHEGVFGVALATLLAQAFSAVLVTLKLMRSEGMLQLKLSKIRFYRTAFIGQIKLGIPTGIESILFAITNIAIQASLNSFGTDTTAAWSAYGKLDAIFWMINTAFGISITTFVGQNYGAGKTDRIKKSVKVCLGMELVTAFVMVVFLIVTRGFLFRMFTSDANVIQIGSDMLVLIAPWYIVYVFIEILAGALRGIGDVIVPVIITLGGICVLRIVWLAVALKISPTISAIIFSYPVTWILTAVIFIGYYYYKHKKTGIV